MTPDRPISEKRPVPKGSGEALRRPRRVVVVPVPAPVGALVGVPGSWGLAAFRRRRSDVFEELLLAGLSIDVEASGA